MKVEAKEEAEVEVVGTEVELEVLACCHQHCYLRGGGETEVAVERKAELEADHHRCCLCTLDFHNY